MNVTIIYKLCFQHQTQQVPIFAECLLMGTRTLCCRKVAPLWLQSLEHHVYWEMATQNGATKHSTLGDVGAQCSNAELETEVCNKMIINLQI